MAPVEFVTQACSEWLIRRGATSTTDVLIHLLFTPTRSHLCSSGAVASLAIVEQILLDLLGVAQN